MVKLQDYLPDYYGDVYEMQKLVAAEQVDFTKFDDLVLRTLMNQFVTQTDLEGISLFENQLGIDPNPNDSLETRQYNVLMRMLPPKPITLRYFKELLRTLDIPASVNVEYAVRNVVTTAKRSEISKDQIKRLKYLLNVYLPANLTFDIITTSETDTEQREYFSTVVDKYIVTSAMPRLKTESSSTNKQYFGVLNFGNTTGINSPAKTTFNNKLNYATKYFGSTGVQTTLRTVSRAILAISTTTNINKKLGTIKPQISVNLIVKEKKVHV